MVNVLEPSLTRAPEIFGIGINAGSEFFINCFFLHFSFEECLCCHLGRSCLEAIGQGVQSLSPVIKFPILMHKKMTDKLIIFWKIC